MSDKLDYEDYLVLEAFLTPAMRYAFERGLSREDVLFVLRHVAIQQARAHGQTLTDVAKGFFGLNTPRQIFRYVQEWLDFVHEHQDDDARSDIERRQELIRQVLSLDTLSPARLLSRLRKLDEELFEDFNDSTLEELLEVMATENGDGFVQLVRVPKTTVTAYKTSELVDLFRARDDDLLARRTYLRKLLSHTYDSAVGAIRKDALANAETITFWVDPTLLEQPRNEDGKLGPNVMGRLGNKIFERLEELDLLANKRMEEARELLGEDSELPDKFRPARFRFSMLWSPFNE